MLRTRPATLPSPSSWQLARASCPRATPNLSLPPRPRTFATSILVAGKSGSSARWLQRQQNDPYVRSRASGPLDAPAAFVSRSAFKLLDLHKSRRGGVPLLRPQMVIVDLGAAPGGWIQAADSVLQGTGTIVGVDLLKLQQGVGDADGVHFVQGDFLDPKVQARLREALLDMSGNTKVDLVLSDMMANTSGNNTRDGALSFELCEAALAFAVQHLSPVRRATKSIDPSSRSSAAENAKSLPIQFIVKHFASEETEAFRRELARYFRQVKWAKPPSSRKDSKEGFFVCAGFMGKQGAEVEPTEQAPAEDDLESSVFF